MSIKRQGIRDKIYKKIVKNNKNSVVRVKL